MTTTVDLAHVFVGCNAISNAFCANSSATEQPSHQHASRSYHAAFAAKNTVALVGRDPQNAELLKIKQTLQHRVVVGDATRITSVFLGSSGAQDRVLAGDSEGNVFLWQRTSGDQDEWQLVNLSSVPQADNAADGPMKRLSTSSVAAVTAAETSKRWLYFVSFSSGTLVALEQHKQQPERVSVLAQLDLGVRFIMETLAVCTIDMVAFANDEASVLLAAGGVDSKVYLYEVPANASRLSQLLVLEGHRGWIRGLSFEKQQHSSSDNSGRRSLFLASASQDQRVRLWKVTVNPVNKQDASQASASTNETRDGFQAAGANCSYTVSFDALLIGHEDWVTSLEWTLVPKADSSVLESALVSSSMDNALVVWKKNMQLGVSGAWFPSLRVGEMGGNGILRGIVLSSESDSDRLDLLALNFMGQLERWKQQPSPSKIFLPSPSLTGHCSSVTDLSWSPAGDYLLSVSLDQTARVLAPLKKKSGSCQSSWHEISRAQVHGYDLNCACFLLGPTAGNDSFVSGADEKILRVFEAPDDIQALVSKLSGVSVSDDSDASRQQPRVQHAYLPELSLTNKTSADATSSESNSGHDGYAVIDSELPALRLPVGDTLGKKTLWPEQRKLYGHGNELLCVASNHSGSLIASACKSREERFASIWLWNTGDWSVAQAPLEGHKSSVVQLAFSPNDQFLLSVSRDRQFCVYEKGQDGQFALTERLKAHKRIIWSCSWSPDSRYFITASRDQILAIWGKVTGSASTNWTSVGKVVTLESAVTAVAFAPLVSSSDASYVVAVGLESGAIKLFRVASEAGDSEIVDMTLLCDVDLALSPSATVTRLAWSPRRDPSSEATISLVLAASSSDYSVRLYIVQLGK